MGDAEIPDFKALDQDQEERHGEILEHNHKVQMNLRKTIIRYINYRDKMNDILDEIISAGIDGAEQLAEVHADMIVSEWIQTDENGMPIPDDDHMTEDEPQ